MTQVAHTHTVRLAGIRDHQADELCEHVERSYEVRTTVRPYNQVECIRSSHRPFDEELPRTTPTSHSYLASEEASPITLPWPSIFRCGEERSGGIVRAATLKRSKGRRSCMIAPHILDSRLGW